MPKVSEYKEGILVLEITMHSAVNLKDVKSLHEARKAICQTPHCLLVRLHDISTLTDEAREFLVSPEITEITKGIAIVVDTGSGYLENSVNMLSQMEIVNKPKYKIEVFENEETAVKWLEEIVKKV